MSDAFADNKSSEPVATSATTEVAKAPYELTAEKMMTDNLLLLAVLFFIFYFILIRPQQKKIKFHQQMIKGLAKGNKVLTSGGLIGTIVKFEGNDIVVLEVAQGIKVRVAKSAVSELVDEKAAGGESANDN